LELGLSEPMADSFDALNDLASFVNLDFDLFYRVVNDYEQGGAS